MEVYFIMKRKYKRDNKRKEKYFVVVGHKNEIKPKLLASFFSWLE